jgi:hypothetical protein
MVRLQDKIPQLMPSCQDIISLADSLTLKCIQSPHRLLTRPDLQGPPPSPLTTTVLCMSVSGSAGTFYVSVFGVVECPPLDHQAFN